MAYQQRPAAACGMVARPLPAQGWPPCSPLLLGLLLREPVLPAPLLLLLKPVLLQGRGRAGCPAAAPAVTTRRQCRWRLSAAPLRYFLCQTRLQLQQHSGQIFRPMLLQLLCAPQDCAHDGLLALSLARGVHRRLARRIALSILGADVLLKIELSGRAARGAAGKSRRGGQI